MSRILIALAALVAILALVVHLVHRHDLAAQSEAISAVPAGSPASSAATHAPRSESQILASCHPHLGPNTPSVPNMDVSRIAHPAGSHIKLRLWVNGDGFVTRAFLDNATVSTAEDQEVALQYAKGLTFIVPDTAECHARQMEVIGNFRESMGTAGDWETVLELHARYSFDGARVVQEP